MDFIYSLCHHFVLELKKSTILLFYLFLLKIDQINSSYFVEFFNVHQAFIDRKFISAGNTGKFSGLISLMNVIFIAASGNERVTGNDSVNWENARVNGFLFTGELNS